MNAEKNKPKGFVVRHNWVKLQPLQTLALSPWPCQFIIWEPQLLSYKMGEALAVFLWELVELQNMQCLLMYPAQSLINTYTHVNVRLITILPKICLEASGYPTDVYAMNTYTYVSTWGPIQKELHRKANCILAVSKHILFLGCKLHKICVDWRLDTV